MVWAKVDDRLHSSAKWRAATKGARALWTTALSWCADQETDGHVPAGMLAVLEGTKSEVQSLLAAGLWEDAPDGWRFRNWAEYQPMRAQLEERRERERVRLAEKRASRANVASNAEATRSSVGEVLKTPTRPDPTRPLSTSNEVESALSPFCRKHPEGIDEPCRACATARTRYEAVKAAEKSKPTPLPRRPKTCTIHAEYPLPCDRCAQDAKEAS